MAGHYIELVVPEAEVFNKDVEFHAYEDNNGQRSMIGRLKVSRGGIEWVRRNAQNGVRIKWKDFAALMESQG